MNEIPLMVCSTLPQKLQYFMIINDSEQSKREALFALPLQINSFIIITLIIIINYHCPWMFDSFPAF